MNYVKKMCILRQIKQGFSGDGKTLSGLIKVEQYGKNIAVEVSIINFAPLVSGEYYCLLSDGRGKTEMLSLRGKSIFNLLSDLDVSGGFCGIVCYVKNEVVPIAYGINGNGSYDWRAILNKVMPPVFPKKQEQIPTAAAEIPSQKKDTMYEVTEKNGYDDEKVATENYYEEKENEQQQSTKVAEDAPTQNTGETEGEKIGIDPSQNVDAPSVLTPFNESPDGYYLSIKHELDGLFSRYPHDTTLSKAFQHSEWVRVRGTATQPQYLVGAMYEDGKAKYLCYALAADDKDNPPEEIRNVCTFVPTTPLVDSQGFFVIFQSAATGECVKPSRI